MSLKLKITAIVISCILVLSALAGGIVAIVLNEINKGKALQDAATNVTTLSQNIYNTTTGSDGKLTVNVDAVNALLNAINYNSYTASDTGYKAHDIATRTGSTTGNAIKFAMGYFVDENNVLHTDIPLYWQAVYLRNGYLTIWLDKSYTVSLFNSNSTSSGTGASYINSNTSPFATYTTRPGNYGYLSNYSYSTLRDVTLRIFDLLDGKFSGFSGEGGLIQAPSVASESWQTTQTEGINAYRYSSGYHTAHHNALGTYTGSYTGWGTGTGSSWRSCMEDEFWIPSYYECFNSQSYTRTSTGYLTSQDGGLWGLTTDDIGFGDGADSTSSSNTSYLYDTSHTYNSSYWRYSQRCWLRSGLSELNYRALLVNSSGTPHSSFVYSSYGVRPAANISLPALKNLVKYNVTTAVTLAGAGIASANYSSVAHGTSVTFTATETNSSYRFVGWDTNGDGVADNTTNPLRVTINADTTYTAIFELRTYTVTTSTDGNGSITSSNTVTHGGSCTVTATPNANYEFDYFILNGNTGNPIRSNPYTITNITANTTITAYFKLKPYNVSITTNDSNIGNVLYNNSLTNTSNTSISTNQTHGSNLTNIYAIASGGNAFAYWQIDRGGGNVTTSTANPLTVDNITTDITITAFFSSNVLENVAVVATYGGSVELVGENFDNLSSTDEITFVSRVKITGYRFVGWYDGETLLGTSASIRLQYSQVQGKLITAKFEPISNTNMNDDTNNTGDIL